MYNYKALLSKINVSLSLAVISGILLFTAHAYSSECNLRLPIGEEDDTFAYMEELFDAFSRIEKAMEAVGVIMSPKEKDNITTWLKAGAEDAMKRWWKSHKRWEKMTREKRIQMTRRYENILPDLPFLPKEMRKKGNSLVDTIL